MTDEENNWILNNNEKLKTKFCEEERSEEFYEFSQEEYRKMNE